MKIMRPSTLLAVCLSLFVVACDCGGGGGGTGGGSGGNGGSHAGGGTGGAGGNGGNGGSGGGLPVEDGGRFNCMTSPLTCAQQGFNCGPAGDGCGRQLNCGTCDAGTCGG